MGERRIRTAEPLEELDQKVYGGKRVSREDMLRKEVVSEEDYEDDEEDMEDDMDDEEEMEDEDDEDIESESEKDGSQAYKRQKTSDDDG